MRLSVVLVACVLASAANAQDQSRKQFAPTVRAATDCASRVIAAQGIVSTASDDQIREAAVERSGGSAEQRGSSSPGSTIAFTALGQAARLLTVPILRISRGQHAYA